MKKEIVIVMGIQASGKSSSVGKFVEKGYVRLNRDLTGGSLDSLHKTLEEMIKSGKSDLFVLDNTYGNKEQRAGVIAIAKKYGYAIKCAWMQTNIEDAQFNASWRILEQFPDEEPNAVLGPNGSKDYPSPNNVPAIALFAYKKSFEKPTMAEGFDSIESMPFVRLWTCEHLNKAIFLDYDGTLRKSSGKEKYPVTIDEVQILPNRTEVLKVWVKKGYRLLGVSNQSGIEKGELSKEAAIKCFEHTNKLLGLDIDYQYCPHHSFPIRCYCRKPLPGLAVYFIRKYALNPSQCIMVGDSTSDATFAKRSGMQFQSGKDFFND